MNSIRPDSFFRVFDYNHMIDDAIDGLTYELCEITKDIQTNGGHVLRKGDTYDTCYFLFDTAQFEFINWKRVSDWESAPDMTTSVFIPQNELAPFLKW